VSQANARDEWRAAATVSDGTLDVAARSLAVAAARSNHAAAEGASYQ